MKKVIMYMLGVCVYVLFSCEDYLDKSPDMGLDENDIYVDSASISGYFDNIYNLLENIHGFNLHENGRTHVGCMADELASLLNGAPVLEFNAGNWNGNSSLNYEIGVQGNTPISQSYQAIRIANRLISNIDRVPMLSERHRNRLLGQAYFMRAWFYFQLMKRYGGMPILDKMYDLNGDCDLPRMTYHESHQWMEDDIEKAIELLPEEWDDNNIGRVNKIAAKAVKSMARLYDASPLMQNGLYTIENKGYDPDRIKLAALTADTLLKEVEASDYYGLMAQNQYANIFRFRAGNNGIEYRQMEYLWYNWNSVSSNNNGRVIRCFWLPAHFAGGAGNDAVALNAPTQNMIDMFEKKGSDGNYYPITDANAEYDPRVPFKGRDPRLSNNILVPGEAWGSTDAGVAQYITTYEGGLDAKSFIESQYTNKRQQTGYICKKFIWEQANQWRTGWGRNRVITVYIRVAQIYLDYAEAAFETTGDANVKPDAGCLYTPLEALNIIRVRGKLTAISVDSEYATNPALFRETLRRERAVELMFENHRWWDIRRWMVAHEIFRETCPIKGIKAYPQDGHEAIEDKSKLAFTYEYEDVTPEVRKFDMRNYWYPFPLDDVKSLKNLIQNPGW